jgi:hypothetical protein
MSTPNPGQSMSIRIDWDHTTDGYAFFLGDKEEKKKLGTMGTKHYQGLVRNGFLIYENMPPETWGLHFCSASVPVEVLKAVLASIPQEA